MANNVLYKTKKGDESLADPSDERKASLGHESNIHVSPNMIRKISLEDEGQFAADFQRQHHNHRWGQGMQRL